MRIRTIQSVVVFFLAALLAGCDRKAAVDEHAGHDHAAHAEPAGEQVHEEGHAGEAEDAHEDGEHSAEVGHADEAGHADEVEVAVTPEAIAMAGVEVVAADSGSIRNVVDLAGEVGFNEDRLVHITPRFAGIAQDARFGVGDLVTAGQTVAVIEGNESMAQYSLKAPITGRIIKKHIAPGEHVSVEESVYVLADLTTVWVNLAVYPRDASRVRPGQRVTIIAVGSSEVCNGTISYVTPVIDEQTRRITARVVLANQRGEWRPGMFVSAHVEVGTGERGLVVSRDAIQTLEGKPVVFVEHEPNRFGPMGVRVGESDSLWTRVLDGLEPGSRYVAKGAFELKAKIVTSSLGGHAGHGH